MIDSHIHLDDDRFDANRNELIEAATAVGVNGFVVPGVGISGFEKLKRLAQSHDSIFPAYGLHPYYIEHHKAEHIDVLDQWLNEDNCVALGECGLDYALKGLNKELQMHFYDAQVKLAKKHQLPIILHVRGAVQDVFEVLKSHNYYNAVMHSFNGSEQQALQMIDHGIYLGFGGAITYSGSTRIRHMLKQVPISHVVLETDAPDQAVKGRQGLINRPEDLISVAQALAEIKMLDIDEVIEQTSENCKELFQL